MKPRKTPRQRNAPRTKAQILAAAQQAFAERGYAQTGIRDIAAMVGVSSPMLLRYFGSKSNLFEAALVEAMQVEGLFVGPREEFGARLTGMFLDANLAIVAPSLIALATGHADAREIASRTAQARVLEPLAKWLGPPNARARAFQIVMLAMGFVLCTRQFPLMPVARGVDKTVAKWFSQTLQAIVDE
jgi:AcrR family transcriptional regulator